VQRATRWNHNTYVSVEDLRGGVETGLGGNEERRRRTVDERVRLTRFVHLFHVVGQLLQVEHGLHLAVRPALGRLRGQAVGHLLGAALRHRPTTRFLASTQFDRLSLASLQRPPARSLSFTARLSMGWANLQVELGWAGLG